MIVYQTKYKLIKEIEPDSLRAALLSELQLSTNNINFIVSQEDASTFITIPGATVLSDEDKSIIETVLASHVLEYRQILDDKISAGVEVPGYSLPDGDTNIPVVVEPEPIPEEVMTISGGEEVAFVQESSFSPPPAA